MIKQQQKKTDRMHIVYLVANIKDISGGTRVIIETSGARDEVLQVLPALTIEDDVLNRGLDIIETSIATVTKN